MTIDGMTQTQREIVGFAVIEKLAIVKGYIGTKFETEVPALREWARELMKDERSDEP